MSPPERALVDYIVREIMRRPAAVVDLDTPLVSSGLIDSLSLVDILVKLEDVTGRRIAPGRVQPRDMDTVRLMFATAERVGLERR